MVAPGEAVGDTNLTGSASHIRNDVFTDWVLYTGFWGERQVAAVHHALLPVPIGAEVQNIGPESFDSKEGIYKPGGPDGLLRKNEFERLPLQPVYAVIEKVPN